jgi:hypothetical protein
MDMMSIMKMLGQAGAAMGGAGGLIGSMRGGQPTGGQGMFPQPTQLGQKPPMQVPMQNQMGMTPPMMQQPNMMMPQPNRFSSALARYGGFR